MRKHSDRTRLTDHLPTNVTTSDNYYRRLFFFLSAPISEREFGCMHARFEICLPFVFLLAGCVSSRPAPRAPAPTPQSSTAAQAANSPPVWTDRKSTRLNSSHLV